MSLVQRILTTLLFPFAASIEQHSRMWQATCPCGHSDSIWERGGVRWYASGEPKRLLNCPACGQTTWHRVHRQL